MFLLHCFYPNGILAYAGLIAADDGVKCRSSRLTSARLPTARATSNSKGWFSSVQFSSGDRVNCAVGIGIKSPTTIRAPTTMVARSAGAGGTLQWSPWTQRYGTYRITRGCVLLPQFSAAYRKPVMRQSLRGAMDQQGRRAHSSAYMLTQPLTACCGEPEGALLLLLGRP